jgi:DNA modification methylase
MAPPDRTLDLFNGSGSTLIGAVQTRRRVFLIELDSNCCGVVARYWEKFTGRKAEHLTRVSA